MYVAMFMSFIRMKRSSHSDPCHPVAVPFNVTNPDILHKFLNSLIYLTSFVLEWVKSKLVG